MPAPAPVAGSRWPAGFRIRPSVDPASADVEVADTVTGRRFRWSPESLCDYILAGDEPEQTLRGDDAHWQAALRTSGDRRSLVPGWRHWQRRGWYPSDQYYVASRRWAYVDTDDPDGSIRTEAIERFLRSDGPPVQKEHPAGPAVALDPPGLPGAQPVSELLVTRRTERAWRSSPTPGGALSGLLWYGLEGVRRRREQSDPAQPLSFLDSYGSAWDFHLCIYNVAGIDPGVYRYEILTHELTSIRPGDHREAMIDVLQGMHAPSTAAWTIGLVADFPRFQWRYRHEHSLRRLYLEAGIIGQELIVLGMSYGLSTLVTPAQKDQAYLDLHGLSSERFAPVYTLTMGPPLKGASR